MLNKRKFIYQNQTKQTDKVTSITGGRGPLMIKMLASF